MERHQVRYSNDGDLQDAIRDREMITVLINAIQSLYLKVFAERKDLRIDGNHTYMGNWSYAKDKKGLQTILVPADRTKGWIESEVDLLSLMLNRQDIVNKPCTVG